METENFLIKAILSGLIVLIGLSQSGCISPLGSVGGPETLSIYKDMQLAIASIENDTERRRASK